MGDLIASKQALTEQFWPKIMSVRIAFMATCLSRDFTIYAIARPIVHCHTRSYGRDHIRQPAIITGDWPVVDPPLYTRPVSNQAPMWFVWETSPFRYELLWGVAFLAIGFARGQNTADSPTPCSVCLDGTNDITRPDFTIVISNDFPPVSCQTATILAGTVTNTSTECQQARFVGSSLCGCPIPTQRPCLVCPRATKIDGSNDSTAAIHSIQDVAMPFGNASVPAVSDGLFGGAISEPSCEIVQAALLNFEMEDEMCAFAVAETLVHCQCETDPIPAAPVEDDTNGITPTVSSNTSSVIESSSCTVCPNGDPIGFPDREITGFVFAPTCGVLQALAATVSANSSDCQNAQEFAYFCGCPASAAAAVTCPLCRDSSPPPYPDAWVTVLRLPGNYTPTCEVLEGLVAAVENPWECTAAQGWGMEFCGCPPMEEEHCTICPGGFPDSFLHFFPFPNNPMDCGALQSAQFAIQKKTEDCFFLQQFAHLCGCRGGVR